MATESIQGRENIGGHTEATAVALGSTAIDNVYEQPAPNPEPPQVVGEVIAGKQPVSGLEGQIVGLDVRSKSPGTHYLPPSVLALGHRSTARKIATPPLEDYPICTFRAASSRERD
jgi:hypothetical protein